MTGTPQTQTRGGVRTNPVTGEKTLHAGVFGGSVNPKSADFDGLTLDLTPVGVVSATGGYDNVEEHTYPNGVTRRTYTKTDDDGIPVDHREDGPAIEFIEADGTLRTRGEYYLDGKHITQPSAGPGQFELTHVTRDDDGSYIQSWSYQQDGHRYEAHISGAEEMYLVDDVISRDGDPAIIRRHRADGDVRITEEWWKDGVQYDLFPNQITPQGAARTHDKFVGSKYTGWRSVTEVAKDLREDIKVAYTAGMIPENAVVTVRSRKYAGGQALDLIVDGLTDDEIYAPEDPEQPWSRKNTDKVNKLTRRLERLANQYGRDNSESMTDYFDTDFYVHAEVRDERSQAFWAGEKEKERQRRAAAAARKVS